jgi:hypothetical protein
MATTLRIEVRGLCALVLDKKRPTGGPLNEEPTRAHIVCVDAAEAGEPEHFPVLTVDPDNVATPMQVSKANATPPYDVPNPLTGRYLRLWRLNDQRVTFPNLDGSGVLKLDRMALIPELQRYAGKGKIKPGSLAEPWKHAAFDSVIELPQGGLLRADTRAITEKVVSFYEPLVSQPCYKGHFSTVALYEIELPADQDRVVLDICHYPGDKCSSEHSEIQLMAKQGESTIPLCISTNPQAGHASDHGAAFYRLADGNHNQCGTKSKKCPKPVDNESCQYEAGGGSGGGIGCSPRLMFE